MSLNDLKHALTCSILTGRYIVSRAEVRLMMHRFTKEASSPNLSVARATALSVAEASRPRNIGFSKRFLKSAVVPGKTSKF